MKKAFNCVSIIVGLAMLGVVACAAFGYGQPPMLFLYGMTFLGLVDMVLNALLDLLEGER